MDRDERIVPDDEGAPGGGSARVGPAVLTSIAQGDVVAMERLYDRYSARAYSLALRILPSPAIAEEAVQEAFLAVWKGGASFDRERGGEGTWVLTVVRNRALDRLRAETRHTSAGAVTLDEARWAASGHDTAAAAMANLDHAEVRGALDTLPRPQRLAIDLAYFEGLTHAEIADRLKVPLGTIKGRLRLGLQKLGIALRALGHGSSVGSEPRTAPRRAGPA